MVIHYQISKDANFTRTAEIDEMIEVVSTYNAALKAASLPDIMAVFMQDAVLLPENQPPIAGVKNIKSVYDELVRLIKFNDDNIVNIVEAYTAGDCGFVRSHRTHGSITEIHTGEKKNRCGESCGSSNVMPITSLSLPSMRTVMHRLVSLILSPPCCGSRLPQDQGIE